MPGASVSHGVIELRTKSTKISAVYKRTIVILMSGIMYEVSPTIDSVNLDFYDILNKCLKSIHSCALFTIKSICNFLPGRSIDISHRMYGMLLRNLLITFIYVACISMLNSPLLKLTRWYHIGLNIATNQHTENLTHLNKT